jgi:hypothetical protein
MLKTKGVIVVFTLFREVIMKRTGLIVIIFLVVVVLLFALFSGSACSSFQAADQGSPSQEASSGTSTAKTQVNLNMRTGPGTNYPVVAALPAGTEVNVVGRNEDSSWLLVKTGSDEGWISGEADFVEVDAAALSGVPVAEAPELGYDANNPAVRQVLNEIPLVVHHESSQTCASHAGLNNLENVANGNIIGPHSGDFVLNNVDNVLFEYTNGTLQLIKENPVARFDNDQKNLSFERAMQLFASGEIVWTGTIGEWPARGVTGCDLSAQSR